MNLEELQIKIGIELKELNKQLKKASDDINDVLGPKATKKMMTDNNKIVKDGFKDMEKTAKTSAKQMRKDVSKEFEAMSKDISKSLNKAFELDMRKFNSNLTQSMNNAKSTVRSACNDIRRELNAALNVKGNIKVNASASASGNSVASRSSDAAAIMQSSQYTGAMITKAVNEMIKVNNANTARLDASIRHIEKALASEFNKLGSKLQASNDKARTASFSKDKSSTEHTANIKADIETTVKVVESDLQGEVDRVIRNLNVSDIKTSLVLDENLKSEVEKAVNSAKADDIKLKADLETNIKLNKDELQNEANQAVREVTTRDIETSIKVDNSNLQDEVEDAIQDVDVPELSAIIELDEHLQNDVNKAIREVDVPELNASLELEQNLQTEVNDVVKNVVVPEMNTTIEIEGNLQNDVNKIIREVDVADFKAVVKLSESNQIELQSEVNNLISKIEVPEFIASFKVDDSALQSKVNESITDVKEPDITQEASSSVNSELADLLKEQIASLNLKDVLGNTSYIDEMMKSLEAIPKLMAPEIDSSLLPILTEMQKRFNDIKDTMKGMSLREVLDIDYVKDIMKNIVESMKEAIRLRKSLVSDTTSFTLGDEDSQSLNGKVVDVKKPSQNKGITQKEVIIPAEFLVRDEELEQKINDTVEKIKGTSTGLNAPDNSNPLLPDLTEAQKRFDAIKKMMKGLSLQEVLGKTSFDLTEWEALDELKRFVDSLDSMVPKAVVIMHRLRKAVNDLGFESVEAFREFNKLMGIDPFADSKKQKPQRPSGYEGPKGVEKTLIKPQRPEWYNPTPGVEKAITKPQRPEGYNPAPGIAKTIPEVDKYEERLKTLSNTFNFLDNKHETLHNQLDTGKIKFSSAVKVANYLTNEYEALVKKLDELIPKLEDLNSINLASGMKRSSNRNLQFYKGLTSTTEQERPPKPQRPNFDAKRLEDVKKQIDVIQLEFEMISDELTYENLIEEKFGSFDSLEGYLNHFKTLRKDLDVLDDTRAKINIDTEDARKQIAELQDMLLTYIESIDSGQLLGNLRAAKGIPDDAPAKKVKRPSNASKPKIKGNRKKGKDDNIADYLAISIDDDDDDIKKAKEKLDKVNESSRKMLERNKDNEVLKEFVDVDKLISQTSKIDKAFEGITKRAEEFVKKQQEIKDTQLPEPNSGLPMVIDNAADEQFDGIRKDIEDAYDKLQAFNKAIADLFDYLQMPIGAKFSKSIGDVEELKSAISNLLGINKFGPGLEGYKKQVEHDSEEIIKDIGKIYQALQTPFGDTPAAFKEVAMLRGMIKEMTGIEPGADIIEEKELKEAQEDFKKVIDSLKYIDSEEVEIKFGSLSKFKNSIAGIEKDFIKIKEDFKSSDDDVAFAKDMLAALDNVKKRIKQLEDEEAEIQLKINEANTKKAIAELFKFMQQQADKTEGAIKDLFDSAIKAGQVPIDVKLANGESDAKALKDSIESTLASYNKLKELAGMPIKDIIIGSETKIDVEGLKQQVKEAFAEMAKMDTSELGESIIAQGSNFEQIIQYLEVTKNKFKEVIDSADSSKEDVRFSKAIIKDIEKVQKKVEELRDEDIKIQAELEAQINAEAISRGFKELYVKATMDAVKDDKKVQLPIDFELVAQGAENLRNLFDLPEFKEHAEALRDILKGIDLGDDLKVNLDLDELLKKLKSIKSIDDIDIDLSDLRTDLIKLAEEADKMRSETEDEIEIKVIDDEVAKITELLKLLDKIQAQYNIKIDVDDQASRIIGELGDLGSSDGFRIPGGPGSGNFTTRRRPGSGSFSTTPGGPTGSGGRGGGNYRRPTSGNFTTGGHIDDDGTSSRGFDVGRQFDSHVAIHNFVKLKEKIKEQLNEIKSEFKEVVSTISKIANKFTAPFKKMLSGLKGVTGGVKSAWSKITGIFRKGAKDCEKATKGLNLGIKDLLKTALSFGSVYGLINLGKQAIQQSQMLANAETKLASLMNTRMGATKETYEAIRQLVAEQAKLGVVSEAALTTGAQQLSMYVRSAKALETLMPTIANMTARRGGLFATENDAEEVATQLGEAIREGSITPLEQSGIYLSEAEIKKFQALRTEEERAAYLAQVVADNIGDINQNLAQTPHGQIAQLKNNFQALLGTLGTLLVNVIQPIVKWLNVIVVAANNALKALGELLGFDMSGGGFAGVGDIGTGDTGGIDNATDSLEEAEDAAGAAEEAVEKFKGALMGFDEINILSDNSANKDGSEDLDPTDITPGEGGQLIPTEITEGENIFTKFGEKMKAFIDEVLEPFKNAWALLGDELKAEWEDLKESFKNFCDSLTSFLKSVWDNGGAEFVQHMAEIALAVAKAAMEIGGEILDSLARLWDHLDPSKNANTQGFLNALNEVSQKLRDFILGLGDHFESLMANGGQDVLNALGDCFMNLGEAAVRGLGVAIDALDGLIDHLDPAVNENTRNMLQALADMFHAVGQTALDFVELLESCLVNGGQEMINAFGDMMMNLGQSTAEIITTMMESFSKLFDYLDPAKNEITKNMMKAWEEAFLAIGDAALQFSELFESVMLNGGQEVLNKLGDAFNSLLTLVADVVKEIADALNGLFEHLDPKTNEFTQGMLKAWQDAFDGITEMCQSIGDTLASAMDNGGQEVVNAIGDLGVRIVGAFGKIVDEVSGCVGELFRHLDPAENEIAKGALESFEYFIDSIGGFVDSLADALGTFMDNGGQEFINNIADIIAIIGDLAFTIGGDILNTISTFMDSWLGHAVISTCATALELVSEALKGLLEILEPLSPIISGVVTAFAGFQVAQKVVGFITSIVGAFKTLTGAGGVLALAKGAFTALWGVLAANPIAATVAAIVGIGTAIVALYNKCEGFREFIDGILAGFQDLFNELEEAFSTLLEDVRNIFENVIDIIVGIFTGDGERVGEAVRELIGNIVDLMLDLSSSFVEVGWALIEGLVKGIWECVKAIPSLLAGVGEFIIDFFKGLFGIHSPSTVFAELGVNLIEGLVKGITDSINSVTDAFKKVGDAISKATKDIAKAVSDKFKEMKDGIKEKLKETKEVVSEKWKEIKQVVSEKAKETYNASKENWKNIKDNTSERCKEIYDVVKEKYTNVRDAVKERASRMYDDVSSSWTKMKDDAAKKLEQIRTDAEKKYDQVKSSLVKKIGEVKTETVNKWNEVKTSTIEGIEKVRAEAETKYESIKETMSKKLEQIKNTTASKWEEIKKDTATKVEALRTTAEEKYESLKEKLLNKLENTKSSMGSKWDAIKTEAVKKCGEISTQAYNKFSDIKSKFSSKMDEVKSTLGPKWEAIKSQASTSTTNLVSSFQTGISKLGSNLDSVFSNIKTTISNKLSNIGSLFKNLNWTIKPKLNLPDVSVNWIDVGGEGGVKIPKFSVSWNARGGIIDGITPLGFAGGALQMGGESGKEMVVPLENTSFTSKIAQAMGQAVDNAMARNYNNMNNNNNNTNENRDIVLKVDDREFARASINSINKLQRESGQTLLDI